MYPRPGKKFLVNPLDIIACGNLKPIKVIRFLLTGQI